MSLLVLWKRLKVYLFSRNTIWLLRRDKGVPIPEVNSPANIVQISSQMELKDILTAEPEKELSIYEEMLANGELCYCGYINQRYVARSWVISSGAEIKYLRAWKTYLPFSSVYIHGLFTIPYERGKHIAQKIIAEICSNYFNKDIYTMVLPIKTQSLKAFYRCGFVPVKSITIRYFCFMPFIREKNLSGEQVL